MNKRWSYLKPDLTQSALIGLFTLKNLILADKGKPFWKCNTHPFYTSQNPSEIKLDMYFQLGRNSVAQEAFKSPTALTMFVFYVNQYI